MTDYAILVDYEWCSGCHTCEVACQMEHDLPTDQFGIKISEIGPWRYGERSWQLTNFPVLTEQCDYCEARVSQGKLPTCVHHCQARCLTFGTLEELTGKLAAKRHQALLYN